MNGPCYSCDSATRKTAMTDNEMPAIHASAHRLIVSGHLPPPFTICPHDSRPMWSIVEMAMLFDMRPDALISILLERGPVHLQGDRGIPSSWRMLIEG